MGARKNLDGPACSAQRDPRSMGASVSALEVVPLVLIGVGGLRDLAHARAKQLDAARPLVDPLFVGVAFLSLLPISLSQAWASIDTGLWYARSADFLQQPVFQTLRWLRIVGDTICLAGVASFA